MTEVSTHARSERAHRSILRLDDTRLWVPDCDEESSVACVRDTQDGAYLGIATEPRLALDVNYHPFPYRDLSSVDCGEGRLAA